jgi:hypothetical protein
VASMRHAKIGLVSGRDKAELTHPLLTIQQRTVVHSLNVAMIDIDKSMMISRQS